MLCDKNVTETIQYFRLSCSPRGRLLKIEFAQMARFKQIELVKARGFGDGVNQPVTRGSPRPAPAKQLSVPH
jgi:hypothetical protein